MADTSEAEKKPSSEAETKAKADADAAKELAQEVRYKEYRTAAIKHGDIKPEIHDSFTRSMQEGLSSFDQFLDLFFTMIFSPEDLEIKKIMYGWDISEPKAEWMLQPWERAVKAQENLLHPDRNQSISQFFGNKIGKDLLIKDTLLRPDLLREIERGSNIKGYLKEIIEGCSDESLNSTYPLDPYLVANHLFELNMLNKEGMRNLDETLKSIAKNSALYGGQPLSIISMSLGDDPINWIARNLDPQIDPGNITIGRLMDNINAYNEEHAANLSLGDGISKTGKLTEISKAIVNSSSAYWNDAQRAEAQALMTRLGIDLTLHSTTDKPEVKPEVKASEVFETAATAKEEAEEVNAPSQSNLEKICTNGKDMCSPPDEQIPGRNADLSDTITYGNDLP